jgi:hypothetical protein
MEKWKNGVVEYWNNEKRKIGMMDQIMEQWNNEIFDTGRVNRAEKEQE